MSREPPLSVALPRALARALAALPPDENWDEESRIVSRRLRERLARDLLPRLSTEAPVLLAAIAGPNNVGKSTLFNGLVGMTLSPARAEGGLTKQCLAAVNPSTWTEPLRRLLEQRYEVIEVAPDSSPPVDERGPPGRLYIAPVPAAPRGLLLLDTPDFDSVYRENRAATEALLVTVDVVLFVVSRQTYQNAALVEFLREVVGRGRPYALVYNEAGVESTARSHLDKLAADAGQAPFARYLAPHDPRVERGEITLSPKPLDDAPPLSVLLSDGARVQALKAQALAAGLAEARAELALLVEASEARAQEPSRLRGRVRHELHAVGVRAAQKSVPADVLVEAFRDELDARSRVHRMIRLPFRGLASAMTFVGRKLRASMQGPEVAPPPSVDATEETLKDGLRTLVEALASEVSGWSGDEATRTLLLDALGPRTLAALGGRLELPALSRPQADRAQLYRFCRELVAKELGGGVEESALQALTTLVYSVPASAAALVTVITGGVGQDAVVWAGTLLSTPLLERFVDLLGTQVRANVVDRWGEDHGTSLAKALEAQFFSPLLVRLDAQVAALEEVGRVLGETLEELRKSS